MEFWKWYLGGITSGLIHLPKAIKTSEGEGAIGALIIGLSIILSAYFSLYYLLSFLLPGITICIHAIWRVNKE